MKADDSIASLHQWASDKREARSWNLRQRLAPEPGKACRASAQRHERCGEDETGDDLIKLTGSIYVEDDNPVRALELLVLGIEKGEWTAPP